MTIQFLLDKINEENPNSFTDEKLIEFVNDVEHICGTWLHMADEDIPVYTEDDMETELLIPAPHDRLYTSYVKAMIDYTNKEYPSYQVNQMQFEQDAANAQDWIVRENKAVTQRIPHRFKNIF